MASLSSLTCLAAVISSATSSAFMALALVVGMALPDGGELTFSSGREGNYNLYLMDVERRLTVNLTQQAEWDNHSPAWSSDGQRLVFTSERDGNFDIYIQYWTCSALDGCGHNERRLTNHPAYDGTPAWSPDGRWIAFASQRQGNMEVYLMDSRCNGEDCGRERLTDFRGFDHYPAWSPDGQLIAFAHTSESRMEVYVMERDGSYPQALTQHSADDWMPTWSPDGQLIAFVSDRDGNPELYVMDEDGRNQRRLTYHRTYDYFPAWSPDGRRLAFVSERDGNEELYLMDMNCVRLAGDCETQVQRLTWNAADDRVPAWRP